MHLEEVSTENLRQLLAEQQRMAAEELSEEEKYQPPVQRSSSEIKGNTDRATNSYREDPPRHRKANHGIHLLNEV